MLRDFAYLTGFVAAVLTLVLGFQTLNVDYRLKSIFGKLLDRVSWKVLTLIALASVSPSAFYLGLESQSGWSLSSLVKVGCLIGMVVAVVYFSGKLSQQTQRRS